MFFSQLGIPTLFAGLGLLFIANTSFATESIGTWPQSIRPIEVTFGPDHFLGFADIEGVQVPQTELESPDQFHWLNPNPNWRDSVQCGEPTRGHGYIHTLSTLLGDEKTVKIGIPIKFKYETKLNGIRKQRLLVAPLLSITTYQMNADNYLLTPLSEEVISMESLQQQQGIQKTDLESALNLNFDSVLLSRPVVVPAHAHVQIRINWNFDFLCGEKHSLFQIGDQINLISVL